MSLSIELQLKCMQHSKRFCKICEVRFDETTPRSRHCECPISICVPYRVEQLFGDIEKYEDMIGRYAFCQVQMESLPPVPSTWSGRLGLTFRPDAQKWDKIAELFLAVCNPVRTVFPGADGKPAHIVLSIGGKLIWEGTESEETALRLSWGEGSTETGSTVTGSTVAGSTETDLLR